MKPHTLKHIHESTEAIYKELDALYIIWPLLFLQGQKPPPSGWFWAPQLISNFLSSRFRE